MLDYFATPTRGRPIAQGGGGRPNALSIASRMFEPSTEIADSYRQTGVNRTGTMLPIRPSRASFDLSPRSHTLMGKAQPDGTPPNATMDLQSAKISNFGSFSGQIPLSPLGRFDALRHHQLHLCFRLPGRHSLQRSPAETGRLRFCLQIIKLSLGGKSRGP